MNLKKIYVNKIPAASSVNKTFEIERDNLLSLNLVLGTYLHILFSLRNPPVYFNLVLGAYLHVLI